MSLQLLCRRLDKSTLWQPKIVVYHAIIPTGNRLKALVWGATAQFRGLDCYIDKHKL